MDDEFSINIKLFIKLIHYLNKKKKFFFLDENAKFYGKLRRLFIGKANFREACSAFSQLPSFTPTKMGCDPGKLVARKSKMSDSGRASRQTEAVPAVIPSATVTVYTQASYTIHCFYLYICIIK